MVCLLCLLHLVKCHWLLNHLNCLCHWTRLLPDSQLQRLLSMHMLCIFVFKADTPGHEYIWSLIITCLKATGSSGQVKFKNRKRAQEVTLGDKGTKIQPINKYLLSIRNGISRWYRYFEFNIYNHHTLLFVWCPPS